MAGIFEIAAGKYNVCFYPKQFVDNIRTETWNIPQRYIPQHVLGHGSYGTVVACIDTQTQRRVAIKHLHNFAIPPRAASCDPCTCFTVGKVCAFDEHSSRCSSCNCAIDVCFCHIAPTLIRVLREIAVLKELRAHPNILKIIDIFPPTTVTLGSRHKLQVPYVRLADGCVRGWLLLRFDARFRPSASCTSCSTSRAATWRLS